MPEPAGESLPSMKSWPRWAEAPIEQYLAHQPEQGDWPWEDHCNGLAGGILAALRAAGVVVVPVGDLRAALCHMRDADYEGAVGRLRQAADFASSGGQP